MKPDDRKTTYTKLQTETMVAPKVVFGTTALKWIQALVEAHTTEVGFYAIVDERGEGDDKNYFIRDVFYPKHSEMNGSTCEISPDGENEMMEWLLDHGREADIPKVRFWGHSHCNMGTTPSGQDESQALARMAQTRSYLIRAIVNKSGEISISFFDYNAQIRFDNVKWEKEDDIGEDIIGAKLARIQEILNDGEVSPSDKLLDIARTTMSDDQMDSINKKIKALKVENAPPKTTIVGYQGGRRGGGHQTNLYLPEKRFGPHEYADYDDLDRYGTHCWDRDGFPQGDLLDDNEVDEMVAEWHGQGVE